ncbi:MAG TPA: UDP-N-acetylmuramoyl-L-alanyl-D-glutamate--2,6-diaminopimelate ligase [Beijerinckiaceae bacterium]|nr:UDP-N-acetylmuramoyl-L-alanyl-D-glutamate--2,6-diaminopimelate ligase [Beijerinckiaceae bacterium]
MSGDFAELSHRLGLQPEPSRPAVTGIAFDSRKVQPGNVFFALAGSRTDGAKFIADAARAGAAAIIGEAARPADLPATVIYARVDDARLALARAAAWFHPRQPGTILAVTGTAGKSSVADFTRQIFQALGHESASLGTLGVISRQRASYGSLTTPDPVALHQELDGLVEEGVTHLAIEASSHGLDQRRLDGLRLTGGAFTNLGRDHLDYHATVDDYLKAKLRLFTALLPTGAPVVINRDGDRSGDVLATCEKQGLKPFTTGRKGEHLRLLSVGEVPFGQALELAFGRHVHAARLPLIGGFQVENALVAAGFALALGEAPKAVFEALARLTGVPGRLERVGARGTAPVFVDYAHKPEALAHVLDAVRPSVRGRLIVVFGCGGDRDKGKRPIMGAIAADKADIVIITDDNPRSEEPVQIRREILMAAPGALEIGDRAAAIREAVAMLKDGDALIVAGKGHETGQIVGSVTRPFSDHDEARAALHSVGGTPS